VQVGDWVFIKATATLQDDSDSVSVTAYARHEDQKKSMDASQISGACSSYARKYALNGLFCIDDNKDSDSTNTHGKGDDSGEPKKADQSDAKKIEEARKSAGLSSQDVVAIINNPPFCANRIGAVLKKHVPTLIERIEQQGNNKGE
jgi:hypothetical protein